MIVLRSESELGELLESGQWTSSQTINLLTTTLLQDGHIDFREFMIVLYIMSNGTPEENLNQIFRVFDINNDGKITLKVRMISVCSVLSIIVVISVQELQKIVRDLFLLINESNADKASQETVVKSGNYRALFSVLNELCFSFQRNGRES